MISSPVKEHDERLGISVYYVRVNDEPALYVRRKAWGKGKAYVLPLSQAYLIDDDTELMVTAVRMSTVLGLGDHKDYVHRCMDILLKHVDGLVNDIPPAPIESRTEIENMIDRHNMDIKIDGQSIIQ